MLQSLEFVARTSAIVPISHGVVCAVRAGTRVRFQPDRSYRAGEWSLSTANPSRFFLSGDDVARVHGQLCRLMPG